MNVNLVTRDRADHQQQHSIATLGKGAAKVLSSDSKQILTSKFNRNLLRVSQLDGAKRQESARPSWKVPEQK